MTFQIYNKNVGFWVGESDAPSQDPAFGSTEVPLPGEVGQGLTYAFDESIQMWRSYTMTQWEAHMVEITQPVPTTDEQFKAMVTGQLAGLSKSVVGLSTQLVLTTQLVKELQAQVKELQAQVKQLTAAKETVNNV